MCLDSVGIYAYNAGMDILKTLIKNLVAHKGTWPEISEATGVPYFTITNLVQGKVKNPRIETVQKLSDYFRKS